MPDLTLLLPARTRFRGQQLSAELGRLLGRADQVTGATAGSKPQLLRHFDVIPRHCSEAPITRQLDAHDAIHHAWLRADPAYVQPDINGARMLACGDLGLTIEECQELLAPLKPLFGNEGFPISAPMPQRWYLMLPRETRLPTFASPEDVLGDDLEPHLPAGDAGRRWRRLLNEAQIILHNHPLNASRIARGKPPVNSLWFWGGGALPDFVSMEAHAYGEEALLCGLAELAKSPARPLPARWSPTLREADALVDLRALRDSTTLSRDWVLPAAAALRNDDRLHLDFSDGSGFTIARSQRWRFWRRALPHLAEPDRRKG
jgi:hypothetical protein